MKKFLISVFVLLNVTMMILSSLPNRSLLNKKIINGIRYYQSVLGLTQAWNMFSPNPSSRNAYVEAEISFNDGSLEKWTFPRPSQMDTAEKFLGGERYRKFSQEHLASPTRTHLWNDLGKFTAREVQALENQGRQRSIKKITFFRYRNFILPPDKEFIPHGQLSNKFSEEFSYTYIPKASSVL